MKLIRVVFFSLFTNMLLASGGSDYYIKERCFAFQPTFDITSNYDYEELGSITKGYFSYEWTDCEGNVIATATKPCYTLYVSNNNGEPIGSISPDYLSFFHSYSIYDAFYNLIATASTNCWETELVIKTPYDNEVCLLEYPDFCSRTWTIKPLDILALEESGIDPCLVIFCSLFHIEQVLEEKAQEERNQEERAREEYNSQFLDLDYE